MGWMGRMGQMNIVDASPALIQVQINYLGDALLDGTHKNEMGKLTIP